MRKHTSDEGKLEKYMHMSTYVHLPMCVYVCTCVHICAPVQHLTKGCVSKFAPQPPVGLSSSLGMAAVLGYTLCTLIHDGLRIVPVLCVVHRAMTDMDGEAPWRPTVLILWVISLAEASLCHKDSCHALDNCPAVAQQDTPRQRIKVHFFMSSLAPNIASLKK